MTPTVQRVLGLRSAVRHLALNSLSTWDRAARRAPPSTNRVQILLLHHVFAGEAGAFRTILESLRNDYIFIDYSEAVARILENRIDGTYLAISFDDGLKCCLQAADALDELGARACFFVCPSIIGETDPAVVARFCRERLRQPPLEFLNWNDIEQLVARGHEFGGHTMEHASLKDSAAAQDEIGQTYMELQSRLGAATHFAWPYGRFADIDGAAVRTVFEVGFRSCASGVRGCHGPVILSPDAAPFAPEQVCLRRDSIAAGWPQSHVNYFLRKSARRPLTVDETWPPSLQPIPTSVTKNPCTSQSTRFRSSPAAA